MSLPELLEQTRRPLGLDEPTPTGFGLDIEGGPRFIDFVMQTQRADNWCWAAVAVSIRRTLRGELQRQCELATEVFNSVVNCCADSAPCDQIKPLERALTAAGVFNGRVMAPITPEAIVAEIDAGNPLGCGIRWNAGGAHFVVIYGFTVDPNGEPWVAVADPLNGRWKGSYENFRTSYLDGAGRWIASYFTA